MTQRTLFLKRQLALIVMSASLAACGGSGGGGGNEDPTGQTIDPFTFTPVDNAVPGELVYSEQVTLGGFSDPIDISVEGGAYCVNLVQDENGDNCTDAAGTVNAGDTLNLRATASETSGEQAEVIVALTDGAELSYSTSFVVATRVDSSLPAEVKIPNLKGVDANSGNLTDAVVVDGFTGVLTVSADDEGVTISVDGGPFVEGPVDIVAGQSVAFSLPAIVEPGEVTRTVRFSNGEDEITTDITVETRDPAQTAPADFAFSHIEDAELDADVVTVSPVTLEGNFAGLPLKIWGGEYSLNGGEFTTEAGSVSAGDSLALRVHTANQFETESRARITIDDGAAAITRYFRVVTRVEPEGVNRPDPFRFGKAVNLQPGAAAESRSVELGGFEGELAVAIEADEAAAAQVFVNDAAVQDGALVSSGDTLRVTAQAPAEFGSEFQVLVHVGEGDDRQTGQFTVASRAQDTEALPFDFGSPKQSGHGEEVTSPTVTLSGFDGELPVALIASAATNAQASIDGAEFTASPGTISAGQTLQVRGTAPDEAENPQRDITVRVGEGEAAVEATFTILTADVVPDDFSFGTEPIFAPPGESAETAAITIDGFDGSLPVALDAEAAFFSIDGGAFGVTGSIEAGQTLQLRAAASSVAGTARTITAHIGEGAARKSASVTIRTLDVLADSFSFTPAGVLNADPESVHVFTSGPLSGFVGSITARINDVDNAVFKVIGSGEDTLDNQPKPVVAGDVIELHVTAPATIGETRNVVLTVGDAPNTTGAGVNVTSTDNVAPSFSIDFPTPKSATQAETIVLTGRYTENHLPTAATITGVDNHGNTFTGLVRDDGWWQMPVELGIGQNNFVLEMVDSVGHVSTPASVEVVRDAQYFSEEPRAIAYNEEENVLYAIDGANAFISIDPVTRNRRVISDAETGTGPAISTAHDLLFDNANNRLITWGCAASCRLFSIQVETGERIPLTQDIIAAPALEGGLAFGPGGTVLLTAKINGIEDSALVEFNENDVVQPLRVISRFSDNGASNVGAGTARLDHAIDIDFYDADSDVVYVLTYNDTGAEPDTDTRSVIAVDYATGDRAVVSQNNQLDTSVRMDQPRGLEVDQSSGMIYVIDEGSDSSFLGAEYTRPIFRIDPETGTQAVVVRNETTPSVDLGLPVDMVLVDVGDELEAWIADSSINDAFARISLNSPITDGYLPEVLNVGSGADFAFPFALELDAENDRLLVLSYESLQSVGIADGLRSEKIYQVPDGSSMEFGGLVLGEEKLWLTTNNIRGLATIDRAQLDGTFAPLTQPFSDNTGELDYSSDLLVDDSGDGPIIYLATDDADGNSFIKKVTFVDGVPPEISTVYQRNGKSLYHLARYAPDQMIFSGSEGLDVVHVTGAGLGSYVSTSDTVAYDESRQYLYRSSDLGLDRHAFPEPNDLGEDQLIATGDFPLPGVDNTPRDLFDIEMDVEHNRLYGLLDGGRNVVSINVTDIVFNTDGQPAVAGDDLGEEPVKAPSGEAVLISRSENLEDTQF